MNHVPTQASVHLLEHRICVLLPPLVCWSRDENNQLPALFLFFFFWSIVWENNKVNRRWSWWWCFEAENVWFNMLQGQRDSTGSIVLSNQPIKSCPTVTPGSTYDVPWSPPAKHYAQTLNHWRAEEKWCYASLKSEAKQSRLIDDQHSLTLMRPCCPRPGPFSIYRTFSSPLRFSLILFAFSTAGTVIVGFNYFTTKWHRWKIGVCN